MNALGGHVTGEIGREEQDDFGNVIGFAGSFEGNRSNHLLADLLDRVDDAKNAMRKVSESLGTASR